MSLPKFSDTKGRDWFPQLDFAKLRRIREAGVDLGNVERLGQTFGELLVDDLKALDVVWLAVKREDVTADDFQAAMDGETLEAAREALRQAIVNFTPPAKRAMAEKSLSGIMTAYNQAVKEAEAKVTALIDAGIENARQHGALPQESPELLATFRINGT